MKIGVIGTGYIGLTTGASLAYLGNEVVCQDLDEAKVRRLQEGQLPIFEPHLAELVAAASPRLRFTTRSAEAVADSDFVFIAVGTPSLEDGSPDLGPLREAATQIGHHLGSKPTVVVNKSTVPIGSGNWVASMIREAIREHRPDIPEPRFTVVSNPEFLREGSAIHDTFFPDRIVIGGESAESMEALRDLYRPILAQDFRVPPGLPAPEGKRATALVRTDLASAELIKYSANAFLALKISFINEMALLAEKVGADVRDVAKATGLDRRIGAEFLRAGIGWGGSCFGKDTAALMSTAREYGLALKTVQAAREANERQRELAVEKLAAELKILKGRNVALLGLAFKPHTDDIRDAPALEIVRRLVERGAAVRVHDPVARSDFPGRFGGGQARFCAEVEEAVRDGDAAILVTEWPEYRSLDWPKLAGLMKRPLILDGRNFLDGAALEKAGFRYLGIGR
ncbi:MAG TPA: UDP-glucose/GDP-mannose dehydrogenase family protein [bacterium]|nr:UDP-glucose/GDP-mannose dehydrogenase family protein [bacterium]